MHVYKGLHHMCTLPTYSPSNDPDPFIDYIFRLRFLQWPLEKEVAGAVGGVPSSFPTFVLTTTL